MKSILIICIALFLGHCYGQSEVWQNIGPYGMPETITGSNISGNGNGRMCAIAFVPGSNVVWSASPRGGLWKKDFSNITSSWELSFLSYLWPRCGVATIAIDPFDPDHILIGTGENETPFDGFSKKI